MINKDLKTDNTRSTSHTSEKNLPIISLYMKTYPRYKYIVIIKNKNWISITKLKHGKKWTF